MNIGVENGYVNGDYFHMNSSIGYELKNHNSIYYTDKIDKISPNRYVMENNLLLYGVHIDVMVTAPALNQYTNME